MPLPDDLISELLTYVVAHEVGHTLGFPHNMKASSSYTVAQLRDPKFTAEFGTEASIMDYGRFNYVAQPGDNAKLIPVIGPYDKFAVEWGYKPFPEATRPSSRRRSSSTRSPPARSRTAPSASATPTAPTRRARPKTSAPTPSPPPSLGLKNLDRVASYLVKATTKKGDDYELLQNMYTQLVGQRNRELGHVIAMVGGSVETNLWFGDADHRYDAVPGDRQKEAIAFLNAQAFQTPASLIDPSIVSRLEPNGAADRILERPVAAAPPARLRREDQADGRAGRPRPEDRLCPDLDDGRPPQRHLVGDSRPNRSTIDLYRRNLQRAHLELLIGEISRDISSSDLPAICRFELKALLTNDQRSRRPITVSPAAARSTSTTSRPGSPRPLSPRPSSSRASPTPTRSDHSRWRCRHARRQRLTDEAPRSKTPGPSLPYP